MTNFPIWKQEKLVCLLHRATIIRAITSFMVIQGHRFWYKLIDFLLVINTNLLPIMHRFRDIAFNTSKIIYLATPLVFNSPGGGVPLGRPPWNFLRCQRMARVPNAIEILPKISTAWVGRTSVTDDRQTNRRTGDSKQRTWTCSLKIYVT